MLSKKWYTAVTILVLLSTLLAACATPTPEMVEVEVTRVIEKEGETETVVEQVIVTATPEPEAEPEPEMRPNVLHLNFGPGDVPTLDPALSTDTSSVQVVDELTVGLTRSARGNHGTPSPVWQRELEVSATMARPTPSRFAKGFPGFAGMARPWKRSRMLTATPAM